MGLRHLPIIDGDLNVVGMITRADMNEHKLHEYWHEQVPLTCCLSALWLAALTVA